MSARRGARHARRALLGTALASALAAGCGGAPRAKDEPATPPPSTAHADAPVESEPAAPPPRTIDPAELVAACGDHLLLLHRRRLAHELGPDLAKLAGPTPTLVDINASLARLRSDGIEALDRELVTVGTFATLAAPYVERGGYAFIAWTPVVDDVGLAKVAERRPGSFPTLWGKTRAYELLVLDGFKVADYPRFREETLEHTEGASDLPRRRGSLLVVDRSSLAADTKKLLAEKQAERAELRALVERLGPDALLKEVELREAAYLRFQDEVKGASQLDRAATWLEVLEGEPDLALAGGAIGAGDHPEERRRASALTSLFMELDRRGDAKTDVTQLLRLPHAERTPKLKELATSILKDEVLR